MTWFQCRRCAKALTENLVLCPDELLGETVLRGISVPNPPPFGWVGPAIDVVWLHLGWIRHQPGTGILIFPALHVALAAAPWGCCGPHCRLHCPACSLDVGLWMADCWSPAGLNLDAQSIDVRGFELCRKDRVDFFAGLPGG